MVLNKKEVLKDFFFIYSYLFLLTKSICSQAGLCLMDLVDNEKRLDQFIPWYNDYI